MILPGATLAVLGGGQLGRMFTVAARTMGYRVIVLDPDPHSPTADMADEHLCAGYDDRTALTQLGKSCVAATAEFENIPADSVRLLSEFCIVRPGADALAIAQDRIKEKQFLQANGFPVAPFAVIHDAADLEAARQLLPLPGLLKLARFGYDGKGQIAVDNAAELAPAFDQLNGVPCVLEQKLALQTEISAIVARGADGAIATYPVAENQHRNGILDVSIVPARVNPALAAQARSMAAAIAEKLNYCGVLAVEYFVVDGRLVVNELAPRPHNSGHYTLDACLTDQFEQQVRALCGLRLGDTRLLSDVVMVNLLGDVWADGEPAWAQLFVHANTKLHLYGKRSARAGRKMGHFTCLADSAEDALHTARTIQRELKPKQV